MIFQYFVSSFLFTQISDLICPSRPLLVGNTCRKLAGVLIQLKEVTCGSWISIISHGMLSGPFISSRCAFTDLFKLI